MKTILLLLLVLNFAESQTEKSKLFMTRSGKISFHAGTPIEDIDPINNEVTSILNITNGELVFQVLIKAFHFKNALMEEHFNENYMESNAFPRSTFKGKITNLDDINFQKDGTYKAAIKGELIIKGIKKEITSSATLVVNGGKIIGTTKFKLEVADFKIEIPSLVADKISKGVDVEVECRYEPRIK